MGASAAPSPADDPFAILAEARKAMQEAGPQQWAFTQTYLPSGFDRGEEETGRVLVDLPRCVRWDYDQPYPKSFLLCGERLWTWNAGEPSGHVYDLDQAQPGLDLLLLAVPELAARYEGKLQPAGNAQRIQLVPKAKASANPGGATGTGANTLRDAAILIDKDRLVRELTYRDGEGNRTTFRFGARSAISASGTPFTAPTDVRWEREAGAGP